MKGQIQTLLEFQRLIHLAVLDPTESIELEINQVAILTMKRYQFQRIIWSLCFLNPINRMIAMPIDIIITAITIIDVSPGSEGIGVGIAVGEVVGVCVVAGVGSAVSTKTILPQFSGAGAIESDIASLLVDLPPASTGNSSKVPPVSPESVFASRTKI